MISTLIGAFIFLLFGAISLWITIGIVDRGNSKNKLLAAFGWSIVFMATGFIPPPYGLVILLVVFVMVLTRYYDMGLIRSFLAIIVIILVQIGLLFILPMLLSIQLAMLSLPG